MHPIVAELTVKNLVRSIAWYTDLGFSVEMEGVRDDHGLQWVSMGLDGRAVWLLREDISRHTADCPPRITLYLQVDDVDQFYSQAIERGIITASRPQNQWYGLREFIVYDPDGYCWAVNQSISQDETPPHPTLGQRGLL